MKLLEYEAKSLLKTQGIRVPASLIISGQSQAPHTPVMLKSQVLVGKRGKAGGIALVTNPENVGAEIKRILSLSINGLTPSVLLAEEPISITRELYLSLYIDRESSTIHILTHPQGGVEVEENNQQEFLDQVISQDSSDLCSDQIAQQFNIHGKKIAPLIRNLLSVFIKNDALSLEVNPLIVSTANELICGDCKMELDDSASFRHPEWKSFEDQITNTNFVTLDPMGTIATIANGAGLAMATVDAVAAHDMKPANFLDIGGGATADTIGVAFKKIMDFPSIKAIVINIFAGITRCDEVAKAIIEAKKHIADLPPLYIRLAGTNLEDAVSILTTENIPTLATLEECLAAAKIEVNS